MRLTWKDAVATLLTAGLGAVYALYLAWGGISLVTDSAGNTSLGILDPTGMGGVALLVGIVAAVIGGWIILGEGTMLAYLTGAVGAVSAILGVLALVGEHLFNNATIWESVLGAFMASIVVLWGIATAHHAGLIAGGEPHARAGATPA